MSNKALISDLLKVWHFVKAAHSSFPVCVTDSIPVSSSTNWQAAFGFSSSEQKQEEGLGFDPFDITRRGLDDLTEKQFSDSFISSLSSCSFPYRTQPLPNKVLETPRGLLFPNYLPCNHHLSHFLHLVKGGYGSFTLPTHLSSAASSSSSSSCVSRMGPTFSHSAFTQTVSPAVSTSHSRFLDLTGHHSAGPGGIPVSGKPGSGRGGWAQLSCTHT